MAQKQTLHLQCSVLGFLPPMPNQHKRKWYSIQVISLSEIYQAIDQGPGADRDGILLRKQIYVPRIL